jgi:hypothetical protein
MTRSTLFAVASAASFVGAAFSFFGGNLGLGALFSANGTLLITLYVQARTRERPPA